MTERYKVTEKKEGVYIRVARYTSDIAAASAERGLANATKYALGVYKYNVELDSKSYLVVIYPDQYPSPAVDESIVQALGAKGRMVAFSEDLIDLFDNDVRAVIINRRLSAIEQGLNNS